jgi:O-antigen/teichoic acid export membrane protein
MSLLVLGVGASCLSVLPATLEYAHGKTGLVLVFNVAALLVYAPALFFLAHAFGVTGAALAALLIRLVFPWGRIVCTHRRLLRGELGHWFGVDVLLPAAAAFGTVALFRLLPTPTPRADAALLLAVAFLTSQLATLLSVPATRDWTVEMWRRRADPTQN